MLAMNGSKLPHTLRIIIFLLRVVLGLDFFYLGWGTLFNRSLGQALKAQSFGNLYAWVGASTQTTWLQTFSAWAFLAIGGCLVIGLLARPASAAAIVLILANYFPNMSLPALAPQTFINDDVILVICLLIIVFSNAGEYLGIDRFIHIHLGSKHKK